MKRINVSKFFSHQSNVRLTKFGIYKTPKLKKLEREIMSQLEEINLNDFEYYTLDIHYFFKKPKNKNIKNNVVCNKYVDLDNLNKTIQDCISKKYNFDDKKIVELNLKKFYHEENYFLFNLSCY